MNTSDPADTMTYDARQIANWFMKRAHKDGQALSIMSILKLSYIAHGWHLEIKDAPLFENRIEAWQYGPVIPDVYNAFRGQGKIPERPVSGFSENLAPETEQILEQIYNIYGSMSASRLSKLTREPRGPWGMAAHFGGWYALIPDEIIKSHYIVKRRKWSSKK